ncbi:hypothetical protein [Salinisphaera japonica]|uniref:hypothetical protein n=1 Tax=Salinisphaera japonica TaxID=1304270 RepID=UPI000F4CF82E|nr:hypothetical protein [Salinisphaera japonica]
MSDLYVDHALSAGPDTGRPTTWALAHPVWARLGALLERAARYCGTHSAGYVTPLSLKQR